MAKRKAPLLTQPKYRFKAGSRLPKRRAGAVGRELDRLAKGGTLTAVRVVNAARATRSPLHRFFEWNNAKAAHEYRLEQARHLIRSIEVVYEDAPEVPPMRVYVAFDTQEGPVDEDGRYLAAHVVLNDTDARARWLRQALRELEQWRARYQQLAELVRIFTAIDATQAKLKRKQKSR